ncbi:Polysaccharide deacetylase [Butyrivibrio proteoclasticus]|uniref:Polysaccharide deacetylase n=1 Tax=Butyrivibrio proteoclasticus TaxID=43305 RepID=A0A1I5VVV8_9FIRM|nr:polysaccharide deacetylase family protein [Butyrivibrio proteoclasticus]SFQ11622.1 Polysaccharide deacetylase [Butyrivibrio proteoclasticus]
MSEILTLYYHRVNDLKNDYNLLAVIKENFKQQMLYLKKNYNIVRADDDWESIDINSVCITFDDGYRDFYLNVIPIINEIEIPVSIFVTGGIVEEIHEFWWDELEDYIFCNNENSHRFELIDDEYGYTFDMSSYAHQKDSYNSIHFMMKNLIDSKKRSRWLEQLRTWSKAEHRVDEIMNVGELQEISHNPLITIGAHTMTHPSLKTLSGEEQRSEIYRSIETIGDIIQREVCVFSYPFGQKEFDFDTNTIAIVREHGVEKAFSTNSGTWTAGEGMYDIPRICVRDWGLWEFKEKMNELWGKRQ